MAGTVAVALVAGCARKSLKPPKLSINDFSCLNETEIHDIVTPASYEELSQALHDARNSKLKVSIAGVRHTQGGHAFYTHARVIELTKLNKILDFDAMQKTITVQTGATWADVQKYLNQLGYAVKIMQVANVFTVGGALSVNANGIDPHCGPLIESVKSFKIMLADGSLLNVSRTENSQLFKLAIGGYGLFGVIVEVTLHVAENSLYQRESRHVAFEDYAGFVKTMVADHAIGFHFGIVNFSSSGKKLFSDITAVSYRKIDTTRFSKKKIAFFSRLRHDQQPFSYFRRLGLVILRAIPGARRWRIPLDESRDDDIRSRNFIMSPPVSQVYYKSTKETDLLQEYFIPLESFAKFMHHLETVTCRYNIRLLHVELRYIPQNTENMLSYVSKGNTIGVVLFFNHEISAVACDNVQKWTQSLIDGAYQLGGNYYLPIQLHATAQQLHTLYPSIVRFFTLKKEYDPQDLFTNHFYQKYKNDL